jgi:hypothetical protein
MQVSMRAREFARNMHGTQEGDPIKAVAAVETGLNAPNTTLPLQLGADSVDAIRQHSVALLKDLSIWEGLGRATAIG